MVKNILNICSVVGIIIFSIIIFTINYGQTIEIHDSSVPLGDVNVIFANELGMVANDSKSADKNAELLIKGINEGKEVVIDNTYYIGHTKKKNNVPNIHLSGKENAQLIFNGARILEIIDPTSAESIIINGIKFTNISKEKPVFILYSDDKLSKTIDNIQIEDCVFEGNISLFRLNGNQNLKPGKDNFGINSFKFNNNNVKNTQYSFIKIVDIPIKSASLINNTVNNFNYTFFYVGVTNGSKYEMELASSNNSLLVDGNYVICDDSWWGKTDNGRYYTFILYEGVRAEYTNNHVEGMKAKENIALYDAYLSANEVIYKDNIWKNNICFAPDKENNTLFKSKGARANIIKNNSRLYENNKFIIEESYAKRLNMNKDLLSVNFISLSSIIGDYIIKNNTFDVYNIEFSRASIKVSNYVFEDNVINTKYASGNLVCLKNSQDIIVESVSIKNNKINVSSKDSNPVNLLKMVNDIAIDNPKTAIDVRNNNIVAPIAYMLYDVKADKMVYSNNTITDTIDSYSGFAYKSDYKSSELLNNSIDTSSLKKTNNGY